MKIDKSYVAGLLEFNGGFIVGQRGYLSFKLNTKNKEYWDKVFDFLYDTFRIDSNYYSDAYYIRTRESVKKFLEFIKEYCNRKDYERFLKDPLVRVYKMERDKLPVYKRLKYR